MKIVVYNTELEPVTVIDVPLDAYNSMNELGGLKVPVLDSNGVEHLCVIYVAYGLDGRPLHYVTDNEELALLLRPSWLPGQQDALNAYRQGIQLMRRQLSKYIKRDRDD